MATTISSSVEIAVAHALNIPVSTKQCVELSNALRFHSTLFAKKYLEEVIGLQKAVPYFRATKDLGHKRGLGPGRFPQKAAQEFLRLIKSVEANAQDRGLNSVSLKIIKLVANKASIPQGAGRQGRGTKRTHVEIQVQEGKAGSKSAGKQTATPVPTTPTKVAASPVAAPVSAAASPKPTVYPTPQYAPEVDLVKIAKQRAAQMERQAKEKKSVEEVSELYDELKKKGSLRGKGERR